MRILGIDPGGKTGVAQLSLGFSNKLYSEQEFWEVENGYDGFLEFWEASWKWMGWDRSNTQIIIEQFNLRNNDFVADITPKEIIGMLKYWAHLHDVKLWWATPSAHKSLITNEALKRGNLYPPRGQVKGGHSTDGMRLCAYHVIKNLRDREFSERLFPKNNN